MKRLSWRLEAEGPERRLLRKLRNTEGSRQEGGCRVRGGRYEGGKDTYGQYVLLRVVTEVLLTPWGG